MKIYARLITALIVIVAVAAIWVFFEYRNSPEVERTSVYKGKVSEIKSMARLCTVDFYEDFPMRGNIGPKHIFARVALTGSISFDLDSADISERGDTLVVTLPHEIVTVMESTEPDSYRVIDTWNDSFMGSSKFTNAEENAVKSKVRDQFARRIYAKGYVRRARAEAVSNLTSMLTAIYKRPVIVNDPTPEGKIW